MSLPLLNLALAVLAFVGGHFLLSSTPLRQAIVRRVGEKGFQGVFSAAAFLALAWMIVAFRQAPIDSLPWYLPDTGPYVLIVVMPVSLVLIVGALSVRNPTMVSGESALTAEEPALGVLRITRHPLMWGIALWAFGHLIVGGGWPRTLLFGGFAVLAIAGTFALDVKYRARSPLAFPRFEAATSNLPFAAITQGRQSFARAAAEFGAIRLAAVVLLYVAALQLHAWVFGVSAYPAL